MGDVRIEKCMARHMYLVYGWWLNTHTPKSLFFFVSFAARLQVLLERICGTVVCRGRTQTIVTQLNLFVFDGAQIEMLTI